MELHLFSWQQNLSSRWKCSFEVISWITFSNSEQLLMQALRSPLSASISRPRSKGDNLAVILSSSTLGKLRALERLKHSSSLKLLRHQRQPISLKNCQIFTFSSLCSKLSSSSMILLGFLRYLNKNPWIIDIANLPSGSASLNSLASFSSSKNRKQSFYIWYRLANPISYIQSTLPGLSSAGSSLSLQLVVMMIILPSWLRTPSIALRKPEKVRALIFSVFLRSLKMESTSSTRMIAFLGAVLRRRLKLKSLMLSEQLTKQMENLISAAMAWASELLPVPGGPQSRQLRLQGMAILAYHSSLSTKSLMSLRMLVMNSWLKITLSIRRGFFSFDTIQWPLLFSQMVIELSASLASASEKMPFTNSFATSRLLAQIVTFLMCSIFLHSVVILGYPRSMVTCTVCSLKEYSQLPSKGQKSMLYLLMRLVEDVGGRTLRQRSPCRVPNSASCKFLMKTQQESSSLSMVMKGRFWKDIISG